MSCKKGRLVRRNIRYPQHLCEIKSPTTSALSVVHLSQNLVHCFAVLLLELVSQSASQSVMVMMMVSFIQGAAAVAAVPAAVSASSPVVAAAEGGGITATSSILSTYTFSHSPSAIWYTTNNSPCVLVLALLLFAAVVVLTKSLCFDSCSASSSNGVRSWLALRRRMWPGWISFWVARESCSLT